MSIGAKLRDRDIEAIAYFFFAIHWAALTLAPGKLRALRGAMIGFDLVQPRGPLALSALGKRVLAFVQAEGRPRYPHKRPRKRARSKSRGRA